MFCTNCGASNKNGGDRCINCGESLRNNQIEERLLRLRTLNHAPSPKRFDFLRHLFDWSFRQPVTLKMTKVLYLLSILFAGLGSLFLVLVGFATTLWLGMFVLLVGAPVVFLFTVVSTRVFLEMFLVVFHLANHATDKGTADREGSRVKEKAEPREGIQWNV